MIKIRNFMRLTLLFALLSVAFSNIYAKETAFEKSLTSEIKRFNDRPNASFLDLWSDMSEGYLGWQKVASSGKSYGVEWSRARYLNSVQEKYAKDKTLYTGGALIISFGERVLCLFYIESRGELLYLKDNWSKNHDVDLERVRDSVHQILQREL